MNLIPFSTLIEYNNHVNNCLDLSMPLLTVGAPGVGKSSNSKQHAKDRNSIYYSYVPATGIVTDIYGIKIPVIENNTLDYFYESMASLLLNADREVIMHIEDFLLAPESLANAIMSLIQSRRINNKPISKHVKFIIDTNDTTHRSGNGTIKAAINNRCSIVEFPIDLNGWIKSFALPNNIAKEIILFLHANSDMFYTSDIPRGFTPFNSPRSWTNLSEFVKLGNLSLPVVGSFVGNDVASRFIPFVNALAKYGNLIAKIKLDPMTSPTFTSVDDILGMIFILSNHFTKDNVKNFVAYVNRYDNSEYTSLLIDLGVQTHPDSKESIEYVNHIV